MSKRLPDVLELEKLARDLEASVPVHATPDPSTYPKPEENHPNGYSTQICWCQEHSTEYVKTRNPRFRVWSGECPECERVREIEAQARAILATRSAELLPRIAKQLEQFEAEIAAQTEDQVAAYLDKARPVIEADIRAQFGQWARERAESELLADIVKELRAVKEN